MKELNNFRNFLNEDLDEGVIDKLKKFGKKVKDVADKMDGGDDHGGIFHNVPGGKPTPRNQKEELKKEQEGELHEGTWSLGTVAEMVKVMGKLSQIRKMGAAKGSVELENLDRALYNVFGDDEFQDAIDAAKGTDDDDRFNNFISDAEARAKELYRDELRDAKEQGETGFEQALRFGLEENDAVLDEIVDESFIGDLATRIRKRKAAKKEKERFTKGLDMKMGGTPKIDPEFTKGLEENDAVLDEVIKEGNIFDEIDEMTKTLAVHMSTEDVLEELMSELQIIQGGTKTLHRALKNIMIDADLMENKDEE